MIASDMIFPLRYELWLAVGACAPYVRGHGFLLRGCEIPCNDEPQLKGRQNEGLTTSNESSNSSTPNLSSREQTPTFRRKVYATNSSGSSSLDGNGGGALLSRITINPHHCPDHRSQHCKKQSTHDRSRSRSIGIRPLCICATKALARGSGRNMNRWPSVASSKRSR
uniref:Putative ubiquitin specific protease n=1 Tax=Anopheles darlingi TaxID=43151 RepID=A0A2M4DQN1_ANODA